MSTRTSKLLAVFFVATTLVFAQAVKVTTSDGGSVVTNYIGAKLNKNSTLHRTWVVINDPSCPLQLSNTGIATMYAGSSELNYAPMGTAQASEPIAAFEIRYLLYDVFGDHITTLSDTELTDLPAEKPFDLKGTGSWNAWETAVSKLLTVVSFVAQVRTTEGKVWRYQEKAISEELNNIRLRVETGVLEPAKGK